LSFLHATTAAASCAVVGTAAASAVAILVLWVGMVDWGESVCLVFFVGCVGASRAASLRALCALLLLRSDVRRVCYLPFTRAQQK
jgi:hypothetical protein